MNINTSCKHIIKVTISFIFVMIVDSDGIVNIVENKSTIINPFPNACGVMFIAYNTSPEAMITEAFVGSADTLG